MGKIMDLFHDSAKNFKDLRCLIITALFIALQIILDMFCRIQITQELRIDFAFLGAACIGMLYGPSVGIIAGIVSDVLGYVLAQSPGGFFPGFTVTTMVAGLIYGCFLYRKKITVVRCILTKLTVNVGCNILLNSLWFSLLNGQAMFAIIASRILKNVILLPIEIILLYFVCNAVYAIYVRSNLRVRNVT